jgi:hypothetical protein
MLPKPDVDDEKNLPALRIPATPDWGPTIRVRIYTPNEMGYSPADGDYEMAPTAMGKTGQHYRGVMIRGGASYSNGELTVRDGTYLFPGVDEEITRVFWDVQEKSKPEKLFSFRLNDIPLPELDPATAGGQKPAPVDTPAVRPFYQKGGGVLLMPIQAQGKPVPDGALRVGMAEKEGAEWGPVRWVELPVGADGTARLEDVKPGVYRLLRAYTPRTLLSVDLAKGHWSNAETRVEATAGKELVAEPLRWDAGPAPKSAGTAPAGAIANHRR